MSFATESFIAVYTAAPKSYCDEEFFANLALYKEQGAQVHIVDNTYETLTYVARLQSLAPWADSIHHIDIAPGSDYFLNAVCSSANKLRDLFLQTSFSHFIIIESDVLPPTNLFALFEEVHTQASIIGGIYYKGYHQDEWFDETHAELIPGKLNHAILSGCTLYSRELIEQFPFNWNTHTPAAFPDAFMTDQAILHNYKAAHYTKIKCQHLATSSGDRGFGQIVPLLQS